MNIKVLTERKYNQGISRQVVYEWEDDFCRALDVKLEYLDSYTCHPFARVMRKLRVRKTIKWDESKDIALFYAMNIDLLRLMAWYIPNIVPILLDVTLDEIDELHEITKNLPFFWVTSMSIYDEMKKRYPDCTVCYIPQTVSERHFDESDVKSISFIQYGRRNPVLHSYAKKYCDTKGGSYLYRHTDASKGMVLYTNKQETEIGIIESREDFIGYLKKSAVSLCSTPLKDQTRNFGAGIDFFTARWYESVACRCYIIARWSELVEKEVARTRMDTVAVNVSSYGEFEKLADVYLKEERCLEDVKNFLVNNDAFSRAREVKSHIESTRGN